VRWFDLEPALHDLDIDIKDLQKIFGPRRQHVPESDSAQPPLEPPVPFGP
jgi:hypothetical protein